MMPFWRGSVAVVRDVLCCPSVLEETALEPVDEIRRLRCVERCGAELGRFGGVRQGRSGASFGASRRLAWSGGAAMVDEELVDACVCVVFDLSIVGVIDRRQEHVKVAETVLVVGVPVTDVCPGG